MQKLFEEVSKQVTPNKKERKQITSYAQKVLAELKKLGYEGEVEGSLAKDTWVAGNHDIDIFIFFEPTVSWADLEKKGLEEANIVITVSKHMKRQLIERYKSDERKIKVIYNGIDYTKFFGLTRKEHKNIVLFLGRLTNQKGPYFL